MTSIRRLNKEYQELLAEPIIGVLASPISESNVYEWVARIQGPPGSPYEGGEFLLDIRFPQNYPFSAPKCVFKTKIYHPNISESGAICLDILSGSWSPILTLAKILLSISSLLTDPNPDDPLVSTIAAVFKKDPAKYKANAISWTKKYAIG